VIFLLPQSLEEGIYIVFVRALVHKILTKVSISANIEIVRHKTKSDKIVRNLAKQIVLVHLLNKLHSKAKQQIAAKQ
jgi:hypothetical protein